MQEQQVECVIELCDRVWADDRYLVRDPFQLRLLARVFPCDQDLALATHRIDLHQLNRLAQPLGFLATWEPDGLLVFRTGL
jgi:hypothetical protein